MQINNVCNEIGGGQPLVLESEQTFIKENLCILDVSMVGFEKGVPRVYENIMSCITSRIPIDVKKLGIDMMSVSGHKFGALKGTGFLYVNKHINFEPMLLGGHQEMNMRAGTENVAGIYAMGNRVKYIMEHGYNVVHVANITRKLSKAIYEKCGDLCEIIANGAEDTKWRLPNNLSLTFRGINAEALLIMLSEQGIYCSAGSACSAGLPEPSRVLKAIGLSDEDAKSTLRFTVTEDLTDEDIDYVADTLKRLIPMTKK